MANSVLQLDYPHKNIQPIVEDEARFKVLCAGRRTGKTSGAKYLAAKKLLSAKSTVSYITPTYDMASEIFNLFYTGLESISESRSSQQQIIRLKNGSTFRIFSADSKGNKLRGIANDFVVLDEAAIIPDLKELFFLSVMPTLADRSGKALIISTPRGRNDFYDLWQMGKIIENGKKKHPTWKSWNLKTADNPYINPEEIEIAKSTMPEVYFRQEYLGEFILDGGGFFRGVRDASSIRKLTDNGIVPYKGNFVFGIDFGRKNDFTVVCVLDTNYNVQVAMYRFNKLMWEDQMKEIKRINEIWRPSYILAEENSFGEQNISNLNKLGVATEPFYTTSQSKKKIIDNLSVDIEQLNISLLEDEIQIQELEAYEMKMSESGNYKFGAPRGSHDDCLKPETLIKTIEGYKTIDKIKVGDLVLTHTGNYKPVEKILEKQFNGNMHKLYFESASYLETTYNHPIYVLNDNNDKVWEFPENIKDSYKSIMIFKQFKKEKDFVLYEKDYYINPKQANNNLLKEIKIDKDFCKFLGRFLADGHARKTKEFYNLTIAFDVKEVDEIDFYEKYLDKLNISHRRVNTKTNCIVLDFSSKLLWYILSECYNDKREKVLPKYMQNIGKNLEYCLYGWLEGDGWKSKTGEYIGCSISKTLALEMRDIAFSCGLYACLHIRKGQYRKGNLCKDQYWVTISRTLSKTKRIKKLSEFEFGSKIKSNEIYNYNGIVYNLQVADDHSFIADGFVVHNCVMALAIANEARRQNLSTGGVAFPKLWGN